MKVPIIGKTLEDGVSIVYNGNREVVPFPFKPYVWVREILVQQLMHLHLEGPFEVTELWSKKPIRLTKAYFDSPFEAFKFYKQHRDTHNAFTDFYTHQLIIEEEDFYLKYAQTEPLRILMLDIEVYTDGSGIFPKPSTNPIVAIGVYYRCGKDEVVKVFDQYDEYDKDRKILDMFYDFYRDCNPDIVVGFNHKFFDIPYIIQRTQCLNLCDDMGKDKISYLTRYGTFPFSKFKKDIITNKPSIEIHGRIMCDLLELTQKDQLLSGIKDHKLKTLAEWYKIPYEDCDVTNTAQLIGKPEFRKYLENDVEVTKRLFDIYFPIYEDLAELMKVPLDDAINESSSFVPKILIARDMIKNNIIPMQANKDRYDDTYYQAALVDIKKKGFFKKVRKIDFGSYYPSILRSFNLGPDTTQITSFQPYTGKYRVRRTGDILWLCIPDKNIDANVIIKVDHSKEGVLRKSMDGLFASRAYAKKMAKAGIDEQFWKVRSNAIKVIMNSVFGISSEDYTHWSDMGTGIAIVGLARWILKHLMETTLKGDIIELDSVTGDTPIWVRDAKGDIDIIPIEDLHESDNKRQEYKGAYEVMTRNGWKKIKYTKKHEVSKNIHRVKVSDGYVDVTSDHSLFDKDGLEITPNDIKIKNTEIELCSQLISPNIDKFDMSSREAAWLLGFIIAEGSVSIRKRKRKNPNKTNNKIPYYMLQSCQVSINGNNKEQMEYVKDLCNKYFGKAFDTKFEIHDTLKSSAVYKVQGGYNEKICKELKKICYTRDGKHKKVPKFILNNPYKLGPAFLSGLMDGDGYETVNYYDGSPRRVKSIDTRFKCLAAGVQYLKQTLGEETTIGVRSDKRNITTVKTRFKPPHYKKLKNINRNVVTINDVIKKHDVVYDISTEDGTFVTALGNIVLHNTDGVYIDTEPDIDALNNQVTDYINACTKIPKDKIKIPFEKEFDGPGYFYKMKNYILLHEDGNIEKHGVAIKSRRSPGLYEFVIDEMAHAVLEQKPEQEIKKIISICRDLNIYELDKFTMRSKIGLPLQDYKNPGCLQVKLANMAKKHFKRKVKQGDSFDYVKANDGWKLTGLLKGRHELDKKYYLNIVEKALNIFGYGSIAEKEKQKKRNKELEKKQQKFGFMEVEKEKPRKLGYPLKGGHK